MKQAFIMDPLEKVNPVKDTTYFLMLAAFERGHQVAYLDQQDLFLQHDKLMAKVIWVSVSDNHQQPFEQLKTEVIELAMMNVIWLRTDPPFDRRYFYTTLLLDFLPKKVKIVNQPAGVRDWNEKLAALSFPALTPRTLISNNSQEIHQFAQQQQRITLKPIDGHGGQGIFFYRPDEEVSLLDDATKQGSHWVIAQEYLPAAAQGDKRILLVDGEPIGAILRVHAKGQELNNLDMGGKAVQAELDSDDLKICAALKPQLKEKGVFFVGIDVIGGKLIEINVTSPTGLQELSRFSGIAHHHKIMEYLD